jgi:hypothetical protein
MNVLGLERIAALAADPARRTAPVPAASLDLSRPFIPENQTQLFFAASYAGLNRAQRVRYNQLFALRVNEYIMMLERDFVDPVLEALRRRGGVRSVPGLGGAVAGMLAEESRHFEAFAALNRRCSPADYRDSDWCFMRLHGYERAALRLMQASAPWLPFALWIIVAMEESSLGLAAAMAADRGDGPLGPLDPHFVAVHREHAKDEARHIHIDVHLVRASLASFPPAWRAANARLFMAFMRDMTAPKRRGTGARVVRRLAREFPELAPRADAMIEDLVRLKRDAAFQRSLFNRALTPLAFALYDAEPALARLGEVLPAYERR